MPHTVFPQSLTNLFRLVHYAISFTLRLIFVTAFHIVGPILHRVAKSRKTLPLLIAAQLICAYSLGYMQYLDLKNRVFNGYIPLSKDPNRFGWFKPFIAPAYVGHSINDYFADLLHHHNFPTLPASDYGHVGVGCLFITMLIIWAIIWGKRHPLRHSLLYLVGALGATGILLGIFTYAPYAMFLESPSSLIAWVLMLFVGNIEEFANIDFGHFCQQRDNLQNMKDVRSPLCDEESQYYLERAPQDNTAFDLSRSYALTATWLSLISIFSELLADLRNRLAVRFAGCVDVVVGDDDTALRLARCLVEDNKRTWRFEGWHRPDMRWPSATLDGRFSRFFDIDRIFARPRIVVLISRTDSQIAKRAGGAGVIVLNRDLTDTLEIKALLTSRAILMRNLLEIESTLKNHKAITPRRIRLHRMYVVSQNPERNLHIIHQTRSVFKDAVYGPIKKDNNLRQETTETNPGRKNMERPAVVTVHGRVPRVILRLDSASESRSWITEQLTQYKNDPQGVPWLLDAVNTEEASATSIRSRLTYNPDRRRRRLTEHDAQHLIIVGSSPLTMALVDEIAWARQQAHELLRGEIRCYTRLINRQGAHSTGASETVLEAARALRVRQLQWLLRDNLHEFAKEDESGSQKLPRPQGYEQGAPYWPYPHSERLEIPAVQSIRLIGCDEQTEHLVKTTQFESRQTPGLEMMLNKVPHPAGTIPEQSDAPQNGGWILPAEEYGEGVSLRPEEASEARIPQRIWIGDTRLEADEQSGAPLRRPYYVTHGEKLLHRAEADLRLILQLGRDTSCGLDGEVGAGQVIPPDEHVVVVFTEDTEWSHKMAHLIMAKRPDYTAALVRDPAIQGVHRPNAPDPSAAHAAGNRAGSSAKDSAQDSCDDAAVRNEDALEATTKPKQVARYGPSWVSGRQPIDDLWTRLARQNHNLALSLHLEKVPASAYRGAGTYAAAYKDSSHTTPQSDSVFHRVGAYFQSIRFDTTDAERGLASRTPWHESPYADEPDLDKDADQASRRYRTKYLEQLPEFFREEQYHTLSRTILNVQSAPDYQWEEVGNNATTHDGMPQHIVYPDQLKYLVQQDHDGWHEFRTKFGWVHGRRHSDYNREHSAIKPFDELLGIVAMPEPAGSPGEYQQAEYNLRVAWGTLTRTLNRLYALGLVVVPQDKLRRPVEKPPANADKPVTGTGEAAPDCDGTSDVDGKERR